MRKQIADLADEASKTSEATKSSIQQQEANDRSWIARWIIGIFAVAILGVFALLLVQGSATGEWTTVSTNAVDLTKTSVIPIVTLVLGFYFGNRDSKG